jgi:hypothetical protein
MPNIDPIARILEINRIMATRESGAAHPEIDEKIVSDYFEYFQKAFKKFVDNLGNSKNEAEQRKIFQDICDLNELYKLQLQYNATIPDNLAEVAYDFDNPEYPGFKLVIEKVQARGYKILQE